MCRGISHKVLSEATDHNRVLVVEGLAVTTAAASRLPRTWLSEGVLCGRSDRLGQLADGHLLMAPPRAFQEDYGMCRRRSRVHRGRAKCSIRHVFLILATTSAFGRGDSTEGMYNDAPPSSSAVALARSLSPDCRTDAGCDSWPVERTKKTGW